MSEPRAVGSSAIFDEMCWPRADNTTGAIEYALRHGGKPSRRDVLEAASVIAAYRHLVWCPRSKREAVIRRLREVAKLFPTDEDGEPLPNAALMRAAERHKATIVQGNTKEVN